MAIGTPVASFAHTYDEDTGAQRFLVSLNVVNLAALGLASLLTARVLAAVKPHVHR